MSTRLAIGASFLAAACAGGAPTAPTRPTAASGPAPAGPYQGVWNGETDQAQAVSFTVTADRITLVNFGYVTAGTGASCPNIVGGSGAGGGSLAVISNDSFSATSMRADPAAVFWKMTGTFVSTTEANGSLEISFSPRAVDGSVKCDVSIRTTWRAEKM